MCIKKQEPSKQILTVRTMKHLAKLDKIQWTDSVEKTLNQC